MSNEKNLLNESQIRQFMKLASLTPLTTGFVKGLTERTADEMEESHGRSPGEGAAGRGHSDQNSRNEGMEDETAVDEGVDGMEYRDDEAEMDMDADIVDDEAEMDMEVEPDVEAAVAPEGPSEEELLNALQVIAAAAGIEGLDLEVTAAGEPEAAPEEEAEVEMDMDMDMEVAPEEEALEETATTTDDADATLEEAEEDVTETADATTGTDDLVERITKRVAARILKSALTKK